ncbi:MAG: FHA domain-containing protein [Kiritimatiellae bacterium]|nr:FHA domain-containing protein [Kiritimatiellia bacterium]MDD5520386.1 FHA domain-containing protein [Kiritimatiellia bacterium]
MNVQKTVRTKVNKTRHHTKKVFHKASTHQLSSTIPLPLVPIIEEIDIKSLSHLDILLPDQSPKRIELGRNELIIGRDNDCSIHLPLANASRKHARLFVKGEEFLIEDLNSTNGTYVNGVRISRCTLRNHDQIRIGEARIQFVQQKFRA